jgi:hypothetical protein
MLKKSTRLDYIEVMDRAFAPSRTAEHHPEVVEAAASCRKEGPVAVVLAESKVVVGAAPGAPPLPPGFVGEGVIAAGVAAGVAGAAAGAGGGVSTTAIVLGAVGVVGAGAAVAVAAGGGDSGGDSGAETPETYAGPFSGQRTVVSTGRDGGGVVISTLPDQCDQRHLRRHAAIERDGIERPSRHTETGITRSSRSAGSPSSELPGRGTPGQLGCRAQRDVGFRPMLRARGRLSARPSRSLTTRPEGPTAEAADLHP